MTEWLKGAQDNAALLGLGLTAGALLVSTIGLWVRLRILQSRLKADRREEKESEARDRERAQVWVDRALNASGALVTTIEKQLARTEAEKTETAERARQIEERLQETTGALGEREMLARNLANNLVSMREIAVGLEDTGLTLAGAYALHDVAHLALKVGAISAEEADEYDRKADQLLNDSDATREMYAAAIPDSSAAMDAPIEAPSGERLDALLELRRNAMDLLGGVFAKLREWRKLEEAKSPLVAGIARLVAEGKLKP